MVFSTCLVLATICSAWLGVSRADAFHWSGKVPSGEFVEIRGINGNIHAEPAPGRDVEVIARKNGQDFDMAGLQVQVVEHDGGVTICAGYPSSDGRPVDCLTTDGGSLPPAHNDVSVDFTVRVPKGVRFVGRTVNGQVEATALEADTEAHTVNGNVRLSTAGAAFGETVNGSIVASVGKITSASKFSTVNGGITVEVPPGAGAEIHAGTLNGHIHTDFPLAVSGTLVGKHADGAIGRGGPPLRVATVNGTINLRRARRNF